MTTAARGRIVEDPGAGRLELFALDTSEASLLALLRDLFETNWAQIQFGTLIQGAVFEIQAEGPPKRLSMLDGYVTIDFGTWHFHVCIGEHKGTKRKPVSAELARHRRTGRAELYRRLDDDDHPVGWGLQLLNGEEEQQLTVFLPNPFLGDDGKIVREADWSRLALWDDLRKRHLGLDVDPIDRSAARFVHD